MGRSLIDKLGEKARQQRSQLREKGSRLSRAVKDSREITQTERKGARLKKTLIRQGILAGVTIALIGVLIFTITTAWYTNVSKTGSMAFRTESWGFSEDHISVADVSSVPALPGAYGVVPLSIDNSDGTDRLKAVVNVGKTRMDTAMRQRVFFYADASAVINGERVARQYLGSTDADDYIYELLPGEILQLTEDFYTDVPLRWMWVYDLEGYYFRGTVKDDTVVEEEYLRPIEYDLDQAVFQDGYLRSVDGVSLAALLSDWSGTDGYEGRYSVETRVTVQRRLEGEEEPQNFYFYPVFVDSDGYGVWAYLLNEQQIQDGIEYDTQLTFGMPMTADLTVTVQNIAANVATAATLEELTAVLADSSVDVIRLTEDITLSSTLSVASAVDAVIDLDRFGITYTGSGSNFAAIQAARGSHLTVMNGSIEGPVPRSETGKGTGSTNRRAVESDGAVVTLSNVSISGFDTAVAVADAGRAWDSVVKLTNCTLQTYGPSIFISGNGAESETLSRLLVQGCTVESDYAGITGNGSTNLWGTDISVIDSTVSGYWTSYYQPQQRSTAYFSNCDLSGYTGIAIKGGTVTISDCRVTGVGETKDFSGVSNSGWADTGSAIYLEANYSWSASVIVKGDVEASSTASFALDMYGVNGRGPGRIMVQGGAFESAEGLKRARWNGFGTLDIGGNIGPGDVLDTSLAD